MTSNVRRVRFDIEFGSDVLEIVVWLAAGLSCGRDLWQVFSRKRSLELRGGGLGTPNFLFTR